MSRWVISLGTVGTILLYLLAIASGSTSRLADYYWLIFSLNGLLLLGLFWLIGRQILTLWREVRQRVFGAKLTLRMVSMFAVVAVFPGLLLFTVSVLFLNKSIESWFNVRVEAALDRGLNLGRNALEYLLDDLARKGNYVAQDISSTLPGTYVPRLEQLRDQLGVQEIALFDQHGTLIAFAGGAEAHGLPSTPSSAVLARLAQRLDYKAIEPLPGHTGLMLRVAVPFRPMGWSTAWQGVLLLQPVPTQLAADADLVEETRAEYRQLALSRDGLKQFYSLTLTLTLLLALLSAIALGVFLSRRLSAPLSALAAGTRAVAQGDFTRQHPIYRRDELGMLTVMFNRMTKQLSDARATADASRAEIEANKAYLESILVNLTSGVLAFDADLRLSTSNHSAARILEVSFEALSDFPLTEWLIYQPALEPLIRTIYVHTDEPVGQDWQAQLDYREQKNLLLRGTRLPDERGFVLVFDDVTDLVRAQRDAAWGEAAKRLAHEIRNPLTPIQLSAERLAMKLSHKLEGNDAEFLQRATETIVKQVTAMKGMVDAFRDYARAPRTNLAPVELNQVVREVLILYESNTTLYSNLCEGVVPILGDAALLRQVLHNLLLNAQDAVQNSTNPVISICTLIEKHNAVIVVQDNGFGFAPDILARACEPYVTTKATGTGLGLAVVKKIIEEHHGHVVVSNSEPHGAQIRLVLPLVDTVLNEVQTL